MRIIGGSLKGRRFVPPAKNWPTRPTTDISKEGLFNILNNLIDFEETVMLDLFGGTGSHCYEFISRGCTDATYVDKFPGCVAFAEKTAKELGIREYMTIVRSDVFRFLATNTRQFSYIFAGPPYPLPTLNTIPDVVFEKNTLAPEGLFVLEHNPEHDFSKHARFTQVRHYGTTLFSFFR
jgi:16S rRNA (guanine(966)-N(2))-methyltransferase RsmD